MINDDPETWDSDSSWVNAAGEWSRDVIHDVNADFWIVILSDLAEGHVLPAASPSRVEEWFPDHGYAFWVECN